MLPVKRARNAAGDSTGVGTAARVGDGRCATREVCDRESNSTMNPPAKTSPTARRRVDAGSVPPPSNRFDPAFHSYTLFNAVDWETGKSQTGAIGVITRPSMLYAALFATLGDKARLLRYGLIGIAIF